MRISNPCLLKIENEVLKWMLQQSEMEFLALSTLDEAIFSKLDILELLQLVIEKVYQLTNTSQVDIFLSEEIFFIFVRESGTIPENVYSLSAQNPFISLIEKAISTEEPVRIPDRSQAPQSLQDEFIKNDIHNLLILPIKTSKSPIGVMMAKNNIYGGFYSMRDEWMLKVLVNRASIALQNAKLFYEEQERRKFIAEYTRSQERHVLAQSLHDTVAQLLFRMGLEVNWLNQNTHLQGESKERIQTLKSLIGRSDEELRSAISALNRHGVENDENMVEVLQHLIVDFQNTTNIETNLIISPDLAPIPFPVMEAIYRIIKEALANVQKHAAAQGVLVSLFSDTTMATVTIQDNGCGFSSDTFTQDDDSKLHFGIEMMQRLAATHGGDVMVSNNDDDGVIVKARFPIAVKENYGHY